MEYVHNHNAPTLRWKENVPELVDQLAWHAAVNNIEKRNLLKQGGRQGPTPKLCFDLPHPAHAYGNLRF